MKRRPSAVDVKRVDVISLLDSSDEDEGLPVHQLQLSSANDRNQPRDNHADKRRRQNRVINSPSQDRDVPTDLPPTVPQRSRSLFLASPSTEPSQPTSASQAAGHTVAPKLTTLADLLKSSAVPPLPAAAPQKADSLKSTVPLPKAGRVKATNAAAKTNPLALAAAATVAGAATTSAAASPRQLTGTGGSCKSLLQCRKLIC